VIEGSKQERAKKGMGRVGEGEGGDAPFLVEMFEDGRNRFVAGKGELEVGVQALFTCDVWHAMNGV
jgi:hypothetical protein